MEPRRITLNYRTVDIDTVCDWLDTNGIKYAIIPYKNTKDGAGNLTIGTLLYYLEVYTAKHETAIRIKWNCE